MVWLDSGTLIIREGEEETTLGPGDALAYDLTTPRNCEFHNPSGTEDCRYLVTLSRR